VFGLTPIDWFTDVPLLAVILIVSWQWLPFATLILLTAMQSLDEEQKEAAEMDGASAVSTFIYITLPHLARPITVVILIEPSFLFFHWTTENYATVQERSDYFHHALNSIIIAGGSTLIALLIAIPAAWSMAFSPTKRTKDILLWMLSTKMMPPVGVLVPIYLIYRDFGLLDTRSGLTFILCLGNLPIVVWMLFTYFKEIPKDILEAARMDGATIGRELVYVLTPMAVPGLASTLLLNFILAWNEAFWTLNLSTLDAAPLTVFIASYSSPEGLFWAKLSAASTLA